MARTANTTVSGVERLLKNFPRLARRRGARPSVAAIRPAIAMAGLPIDRQLAKDAGIQRPVPTRRDSRH